MIKRLTLLGVCLGVLVAAVASGASSASKDVIEITCQVCEASPTDVFSQSRYEVVQAVQQEVQKGSTRSRSSTTGAHRRTRRSTGPRLALANALPGHLRRAEHEAADSRRKPGKLLNVAPVPREGQGVEALASTLAHSVRSPVRRGSCGASRNSATSSVSTTTRRSSGSRHRSPSRGPGARSSQPAKKLKDSWVVPFAMDGDWVTQLMWANLIGTQPGGEQFLYKTIRQGQLRQQRDRREGDRVLSVCSKPRGT